MKSAAPAPTEIADRLRISAPPGSDLAWRAPGRANLIGEHTDYNDGFVLPVALGLALYIAGRRSPGSLRLASLDQSGMASVDLSTGEGPDKGWGRYATAVVRSLLDEGVELTGFSGVLVSEVPTGAGLASSAALEVAIASALVAEPLDPVRMAKICRRAENVYVGVQSGIMDQLASAAGRSGHALLIDCRDISVEAVEVPAGLRVVVIDSAVQRGLADSGYNERRSQCEAAASAMGVASLRDADGDLLESHRERMGDVVYRRARHVIGENQRVMDSVAALRRADFERLGRLFDDSHRSYAQDFEASTPEVDMLVEVAQDTGGVIAARLTGGGFGGCTVNLVREGRTENAAAEILDGYRARTGLEGRLWVSEPADGATPLEFLTKGGFTPAPSG
ncbi:MAG: galactokinase [Actinobacteria bacterium]|nr:galactokinase [Actinomycetota bacterium]